VCVCVFFYFPGFAANLLNPKSGVEVDSVKWDIHVSLLVKLLWYFVRYAVEFLHTNIFVPRLSTRKCATNNMTNCKISVYLCEVL
jgi:hypothetical protein